MNGEAAGAGRGLRYFFDTHAMIEVSKGTESYAPFRDRPVFAHQSNIYEFIHKRLRDSREHEVRDIVRRMAPNLLEAETDDLFAASRFRMENVSSRLSYVDALGYVLAKKHALRFLTGDRAFKGMENVEYVP